MIVQLGAVAGRDVTVPVTVSGTASNNDFQVTTSLPLTIPAGQVTAAIDVAIVDDLLSESVETLVFSIGSPTNAQLGAVNTIHCRLWTMIRS